MFNLIKNITAYFDNKRNSEHAQILIQDAIDDIIETQTLLTWCGIIDQLYINLLNIQYDRASSDRMRISTILVYLGNQISKTDHCDACMIGNDHIKHIVISDLSKLLE